METRFMCLWALCAAVSLGQTFTVIPEGRTEGYPESTVGLLVMSNQERTQERRGTGVAVSPRVVLTVAHNLYEVERQRWLRKPAWMQGNHGSHTPVFTAPALWPERKIPARRIILRKYSQFGNKMNSSNQDIKIAARTTDMGVIVFAAPTNPTYAHWPESFAHTKRTLAHGVLSILFSDADEPKLLLGYPTSWYFGIDTRKYRMHAAGWVNASLGHVYPTRFRYKDAGGLSNSIFFWPSMEVAQGTSGGAVFIDIASGPTGPLNVQLFGRSEPMLCGIVVTARTSPPFGVSIRGFDRSAARLVLGAEGGTL